MQDIMIDHVQKLKARVRLIVADNAGPALADKRVTVRHELRTSNDAGDNLGVELASMDTHHSVLDLLQDPETAQAAQDALVALEKLGHALLAREVPALLAKLDPPTNPEPEIQE
jgi:hypothetical protein